MKRSFSESDSDEGEFFKRSDKDSDGVENESPATCARKRRRGQIEKKRRDRINNSLAELRQLVPAALKKQGSTKLEKAEILKLTVEHLKGLKYGAEHTRGLEMTRAIDGRTHEHQECLADSKVIVTSPVDSSKTTHKSPRQQIFNHINWPTSVPGGRHFGFRPPKIGLTLSTKESNKHLSSSTQTLTALPFNASDIREGYQISQERMIRNRGLSIAYNYPSLHPLQTPGLGNVLQSPYFQAGPFVDWSMSLITKTNYSAPFL